MFTWKNKKTIEAILMSTTTYFHVEIRITFSSYRKLSYLKLCSFCVIYMYMYVLCNNEPLLIIIFTLLGKKISWQHFEIVFLIFFFFFFADIRLWHFMQSVSYRGSLHEVSKPLLGRGWGGGGGVDKINIFILSSAEFVHRMIKVKWHPLYCCLKLTKDIFC